MKIVRYQIGDRVGYGMWEDDLISEISGSIFGDFEVTPVKHKISEARLLPPVEPSKILCVGLNFRSHIKELGDPTPEFPSHFIKPLTAIIGPEDPIIFPRVAKRVDYEGELALVIKTTARNLDDGAPVEDHILGYTCFNDVTARDLQDKDVQFTRAKSFDTFAAIGPCLVTDLDPADVKIKTFLNGKLRQSSSTKNLIFPVPFLVRHISRIMTLYPGDVITTGTPAGIGPMQPGDKVDVQIEGIGTLSNTVMKVWE